jgi:hypothetical protein
VVGELAMKLRLAYEDYLVRCRSIGMTEDDALERLHAVEKEDPLEDPFKALKEAWKRIVAEPKCSS